MALTAIAYMWEYFEAICETDISRVDNTLRDQMRVRGVMKSLSRLANVIRYFSSEDIAWLPTTVSVDFNYNYEYHRLMCRLTDAEPCLRERILGGAVTRTMVENSLRMTVTRRYVRRIIWNPCS